MLPFYTSKFLGLSFAAHGTALLGEEGIRLVIKGADQEQPLLETELDSTLIRWNNLQALVIDRGLLKDRVKLQVRDPGQLGKLPGLSKAEIVLEISRREREALATFERQSAAYRAGQIDNPDDEEIDEFIDDVRDMLDGR